MTNSHITDPRIRHELAEYLASQRDMLNSSLKMFREKYPQYATEWTHSTRNDYHNVFFGARCMASRLERFVQ